MHIHVIQPGDTIGRLSVQYGVSVNQIAQANELVDPSKLVLGMALVIPDPPRPYTVRQGDTLWMIAHRFGTTVQAIIQANHIPSPYVIYPGQTLQIPEKARPTIETNAFSIDFDEKGAQDVRDVAKYLTYLSPFAYRIRSDASLETVNDQGLLQAAQEGRVVPIMAINNFSSTEPGSKVAHDVLSSPELQNKLLDNIISTMKSKNYKGVNIDFENVRPANREDYTRFLRRAVQRLHAENFFVSSSLAPKTSAEQKGTLYEAHDYPAHGQILDFVVLMTYEWGYRLGPPQAISPLNEIKAVLDYAVSVMPRSKIMMGFQIYARDWLLPHVTGQEAETFSPQEAVSRALKYGAAIHYDTRAQSPFFRYADEQGRQHEVWFEDARSAQAKFDLAKQYRLRGISYWVLGYPYPQNWLLLADNFTIKKLV